MCLPRFHKSFGDDVRDLRPFIRGKEAADNKAFAVRSQGKCGIMFHRIVDMNLQPGRLQLPSPRLAMVIDLGDFQFSR